MQAKQFPFCHYNTTFNALTGKLTTSFICALDDNMGIKLLELGLEGVETASGGAQLAVHLLGIAFVCGCTSQVLCSFLDLQLLADLTADLLPLLVQSLLYT